MPDYLPPDIQHLVPYLWLQGVPEFLDFAKSILGAEIVQEAKGEDGAAFFAMVKINDTIFYVQEAESAARTMTTSLYIYVPDTDAAYSKALAAGTTSLSEPADQPFGDRNACVQDEWGNQWWFGTYLGN